MMIFFGFLIVILTWALSGLLFESTYRQFSGRSPTWRQLGFLLLTGGPIWMVVVGFKLNEDRIINWLNGGE